MLGAIRDREDNEDERDSDLLCILPTPHRSIRDNADVSWQLAPQPLSAKSRSERTRRAEEAERHRRRKEGIR